MISKKPVPPCDDQPPKTVNERVEHAARLMLDHLQIAAQRVEAVNAGHAGRALVFIKLRIQPRLVVVGPVARENDPSVRRVTWRDVVAVRRLIGNLDDDRWRVRIRITASRLVSS